MSSYVIMPNFGYNTTKTKEDSSKFFESVEDNAVKSKSEGGYTINRARYKQKARRLYETAFTNLMDSEKAELQEFEGHVGTIEPFYYRHPHTFELILVQYQERLRFAYRGSGENRRWDVHGIKLREV